MSKTKALTIDAWIIFTSDLDLLHAKVMWIHPVDDEACISVLSRINWGEDKDKAWSQNHSLCMLHPWLRWRWWKSLKLAYQSSPVNLDEDEASSKSWVFVFPILFSLLFFHATLFDSNLLWFSVSASFYRFFLCDRCEGCFGDCEKLAIGRGWFFYDFPLRLIFEVVFLVFLHLQVVQKNLLGRRRLWRMESEEVVLLYSVQECCYGVSRVLVGWNLVI